MSKRIAPTKKVYFIHSLIWPILLLHWLKSFNGTVRTTGGGGGTLLCIEDFTIRHLSIRRQSTCKGFMSIYSQLHSDHILHSWKIIILFSHVSVSAYVGSFGLSLLSDILIWFQCRFFWRKFPWISQLFLFFCSPNTSILLHLSGIVTAFICVYGGDRLKFPWRQEY